MCGIVRSARSDHPCLRRLNGAGVASGLDLRDHYSPACAVPPALNTEDQRTELLPFARVLRHERRDVLQGIGSAPLARANRYSDPGEKGP
jgi:hypothetical protein